MGEKCTWKGAYFVTCGKYQEMAHLFNVCIGEVIAEKLKELGVNYCPLCGADIRKPDLEAIE